MSAQVSRRLILPCAFMLYTINPTFMLYTVNSKISTRPTEYTRTQCGRSYVSNIHADLIPLLSHFLCLFLSLLLFYLARSSSLSRALSLTVANPPSLAVSISLAVSLSLARSIFLSRAIRFTTCGLSSQYCANGKSGTSRERR